MPIKFIQLQACALEATINSSATAFDAAGFLLNDGTTKVATTDIGDVCYATLEPRTEREELISFTIDSVTDAGVATLTVVRGLSQISPYGSGGASFSHQAGTNLVISNNPGLFDKLTAKANDETVTGAWSFPETPSTGNNPVTKTYFEAQAVKLTGDQTVAGEKTFSGVVNVEDAIEDTEPVTKGQFDTASVKLTGDQTVAGEKTFSTSPKVPDATAADEPFTKGQHDADAAASSAVASPSVRGSAKLDTAADTPADPEVLTATADRVAALAGGGTAGTPDADNQFMTEEMADVEIAGFGDSSDGDVVISGTVTLTENMQYQNLTVTGTLITDGYTIKVRDTIDGVGTIKHSVPTNGGDASLAGSGSNVNYGGGGGGSGASGGWVIIYATNWAGTFTIESVGGNGGAGSYGTIDGGSGGIPTGGTAAAERGAGIYKGTAGKVGANGVNLNNNGQDGNDGDDASPSLSSAGSAGGDGGNGDNYGGGDKGAGGARTLPTISPLEHKFLLSGFFSLNADGELKNLNKIPGAGSGAGGASDHNDNGAGGGGGGAGANGGDALVVYKKKTWTGTSTLTGGTGGSSGAAGTNGTAGEVGEDGSDGTLNEVNYNTLM